MKLIKKWAWLFLSMVVIGVNLIATSLPLNNQTTGEISDRLFTVLTPAGFTFAIWGLIYLGLILLGILLGTSKQSLNKNGLICFTISSLANIAWIFLWHYNQPVISAFVLLAVFFGNLLTYFELKNSNSKTNLLRTLSTSWFLIYVGWTLVASVINITIALKQVGFDGYGVNETIWAVAVLGLASIINLLLSWKEKNPTTSLVFLWSLWGIYNAQTDNFLQNSLLGIALFTTLLTTVITLVRTSHTWRNK